ncbi:5'/3'-nucleotidase SurE [Nocardioides mangrovi]|uniref:5'-nucleotidase n=1 Tax=Nocardioides mangrovi TaxID=2874580 RepID=A0ABS7UAZ9_9ACTN|nr:5'/3'-nucleotidase SurE [Nocardioides mangrovi]MBZ5737863.1 5'/3'-nucleotidase SurE [Nocardioides mangrovi]
MHARHRKIGIAIGAVAVLVAGLLAGQVGASAESAKPPATVKGLKILLTNDDSVQGTKADGSDGQGLYELRKALCAAGADVVVIGPWGQQSGQGGRITTDRATGLTVTPASVPETYAGDCADAGAGGAVYGVCNSNMTCTTGSPSASPSDTVRIGIQNFLPATYWPAGPDLVLSGINWGQNAGIGVFHSGTTSAAVTAHEFGRPAIAFSEQFDLIPCAVSGVNCPTYTPGAAFAVTLIGKLRGAGLLKPSTLLNVNFPYVGADEKQGKPALNVLGNGDMLDMTWNGATTTEGATYSLGIPSDRKSTNKNADTTALDANRISIVAMTGDWSRTPSKKLTALVKALR